MGQDSCLKRENYKRYKEEQRRILTREVKKYLYNKLEWESEDIIDNKEEIEQIIEATLKVKQEMNI